MRLLNVQSLEFHEHYSPVPRYAIASHRWKRGTEASIEDVRNKRNTDKEGYKKVEGFAEYVKAHIPHVDWLWIDTCCINQDSSQEVSEAINSMFEWYRNAEVCLAYLADVTANDDLDNFKQSEWFRRGWTLQELLAPRTVVFLNRDWQVIGHKGGTGRGKSGTNMRSGRSLTPSVVSAVGIPEGVLNDFDQSNGFTVEERLEWICGRRTMREEDMSYSLLGIFGVSMPVIYGEGGSRARKRLLAMIREEMEDVKQQPVPTQPSRNTLSKPSSNVPFRRDPDFVDRGALVDLMRERLAVPAGRVALVGLGGAGKSQLAIEYVYQARASSPEKWVFWIHASNAARFEQGMRDVADMVKIDGREDPRAKILKLVRDWLRDGANGPWMMVLDNADDAGFLVERRSTGEERRGSANTPPSLFDHLPVCDHGMILITTRSESAALRLVERPDMIEVNPMDKGTAIALLEKKLGKLEDQTSVVDLVEILEYMPLAITQAAAYIKQRDRRCSVPQYVDKVRKSERSKQSILDFDAGDLRRDGEARNSTILTWQISFEHIYRIRPSAGGLLSLMSFCDRQAIPEALIRTRSSKEDGVQRFETRRAAGRETTDDESENEEEGDNSDHSSSGNSDIALNDGFDDDIAILEGYSFVTVTTNASIFEMHRLVQLATRKWLESRGQLERWKARYIDNLYAVFPPGNYENWMQCQIYFPHVKSAATLKLQDGEALLKWAAVMYNAAWYAWSTGHASEAEEMSMRSLKARAKRLGEDDEETLSSMAMLANARADAGKWKEAKGQQVQVMENRKRVLGAEHPSTLTSMGNLASTYRNQGKWTEAEELEVQVMETSKRVLGEEHPDTLTSMDNLASTYRNQGRWEEAQRLNVRVLETRKKVLGGEHPDTLISMKNLASAYRNQGRWKEAEELEVQALKLSEKVLGEEHPDTLSSMANLASTYRNQGRWEEAQRLEVQVLETNEKVLGREHPNTLSSMANLALTYRNQGRWGEAEGLEVQVLEMSEKVLGEEHPDTLSSMANLASMHSDQGRWEESERLNVRVLETRKKVLGEEHPDTLSSMNNLASTYRNQGRWEEAQRLNVRVLETRKKVLGGEHPDTLSSMANLASTYRNQGRWEEAEELNVQVLEMSKKVLGEEHPDTLSSMANLASTYWNQGRWGKAEELDIQVLETREKVLGEEHPDTLISIANLASTYWNQGRWEESMRLDVRVLEIRKKVLGGEHPDTLSSMANLASTYRNQGRWEEAEELNVQVLETRKKVLGREHPDTLTSMNNLASTYWNQGRLGEAERLNVQVLETRKKVQGVEHPDTLISMANLASTYRNQGRWGEAEVLEVQVLEMSKKVLGEEHPDTLSSMANLASTFRNQGRWEEAQRLEVQVLETRKKVLGEEHPDTLTSIEKLAHTLKSQGNDQS